MTKYTQNSSEIMITDISPVTGEEKEYQLAQFYSSTNITAEDHAKHFLHCVNVHKELIKALKDLLSLFPEYVNIPLSPTGNITLKEKHPLIINAIKIIAKAEDN